jgi:hypothetical protein
MNWRSESWPVKVERMGEWHRWFAWHPVRVGERMHWLEFVLRRGGYMPGFDGGYWEWEYRDE